MSSTHCVTFLVSIRQNRKKYTLENLTICRKMCVSKEAEMNRNDFLKNFAQRAKRRLVGKETTPKVNARIKVISNEDLEFKNKVQQLLSQEDVITNPVHYLIDEHALKNMNEPARERYLLATLDKYISTKRELENSTSDTRFCM